MKFGPKINDIQGKKNEIKFLKNKNKNKLNKIKEY